jgi:hypothetical protein
MFLTELFTRAKMWEQEYHPAFKKKEIASYAGTWMDLEHIELS